MRYFLYCISFFTIRAAAISALICRAPEIASRCLSHAAVRKPAVLVLYGFDLLTPQQQSFLESLCAQGVEVALVGTTAAGRVEPASALATLGRMEVNEVLVEAGPTLAGALLQAGVVDELLLYVAPSLLGDQARALAHLPGLERLDQRIRLRYTDTRMVGADLRITAVPD